MPNDNDGGKIPQPGGVCNTDEFFRSTLSARLQEMLKNKLDGVAKTPSEVFEIIQGFTLAMASSMASTLSAMEDLMAQRDPTYPRGLLPPIFLAAFFDLTGAKFTRSSVPVEDMERLDKLFQSCPPKDKSLMH